MLPGVDDALQSAPVAEVHGPAGDALKPARIITHHRVTGGAARLLEVVDHVHEGTPMSEPPSRILWMDTTRLLDFESHWPRHSGIKEETIRVELGITPARYYVLLNRAIETREALETHPMLVRRLLRLRDRRARARRQRIAG